MLSVILNLLPNDNFNNIHIHNLLFLFIYYNSQLTLGKYICPFPNFLKFWACPCWSCKQKCTQWKLKHHCLSILTSLRLKQWCYGTLVVALRCPKLASTLISNPNHSLVPAWIFHRKLNAWQCRSRLERYKQFPQPQCLTNTLCTHSEKFVSCSYDGVYICSSPLLMS